MLAAVAAVSCGSAERRPAVAPGKTVNDLRDSAGPGMTDCGEAPEVREETSCRVKPMGDCLALALGDCRPGHGVRQYFTDEGDAVRVDWFVLSDGQGGCRLVTVEDRSADPLAPKKPKVQYCKSIGWKAHDRIADCELPTAEGCTDPPSGDHPS